MEAEEGHGIMAMANRYRLVACSIGEMQDVEAMLTINQKEMQKGSSLSAA